MGTIFNTTSALLSGLLAIVILALICNLWLIICAVLATNKNRGLVQWLLLSSVLGPIAVIILAILPALPASVPMQTIIYKENPSAQNSTPSATMQSQISERRLLGYDSDGYAVWAESGYTSKQLDFAEQRVAFCLDGSAKNSIT